MALVAVAVACGGVALTVWDVVPALAAGPSPDTMSIVAGSGGTGYAGSGIAPTSAGLNNAYGIAIDGAGDQAISDSGDNRVYLVPASSGTFFGQSMSAGLAYVIAGTGGSGSIASGVLGTSANLTGPYGLAFDDGNLLITDYYTERVWLLANNAGTYFGQSAVAGHLYAIVGTGTEGYSPNGTLATSAALGGPFGVAIDTSGDLYLALADGNLDNAIRFVPATSGTHYGQSMTAGDIYTIAGQQTGGYSGDAGPATSATLDFPRSVTVDAAGDLYIADEGNGVIRFVPTSSGTFWGQSMTADDIYTIAGSTTAITLGDGGPATAAELDPGTVALDSAGDMVIADAGDNLIRFVPATSGTFWGQTMSAAHIYTIAGTGTPGSAGAGSAPTSAELDLPFVVALDGAGDVFATNYGSNVVEEFTPPATVPRTPVSVQASVPASGPAGELLVTWTPPTSDGGSPITGYTLTANDLTTGTASTPITVGASVTQTTLDGLSPGHTYTVTVVADNAQGASMGAASGSVVMTPVATPTGAPTATPTTPIFTPTTAPPNRQSCRSRRLIIIHLPNLAPASVHATLRGRKLPVRVLAFDNYREATVRVDLRGRPRGAYVIHITGTARGLRAPRSERPTFHTCTPSRA